LTAAIALSNTRARGDQKKMEKLLFSKREAAVALGISIRTLEGLIVLGELKSVRIGRRRMVAASELEQFSRRDHATRLAN
jgi:excisionase family DNA binding protein